MGVQIFHYRPTCLFKIFSNLNLHVHVHAYMACSYKETDIYYCMFNLRLCAVYNHTIQAIIEYNDIYLYWMYLSPGTSNTFYSSDCHVIN